MATAEELILLFKAQGADNVSAATKKIHSDLGKVVAGGDRVNKAFRGMRGGAAQFGYQIQDVAVQLQMGQNAMLVFGQQGSQLASLMGPGGAMIGALIAVGAALYTVFTKDIKEAEKGLEGFYTELSNTIELLGEFTQAQKEAALVTMINQTFALEQKISDLKDTQRELSEEQAEAKHRSDLLNAAIRTQNDQLAAAIMLYEKFVGDVNDANTAVYDNNAEIERYEGQLKKLETQIERFLSGQSFIPEEVEKEREAFKKTREEKDNYLKQLKEQSETYGMSRAEMMVYQMDLLNLSDAEQKQAIQYIAAIDSKIQAEKRLAEEQKKRAQIQRDANRVVGGLAGVGMTEIDALREKYAQEMAVIDEAEKNKIDLLMSYDEIRRRMALQLNQDIVASQMMQAQASLSVMSQMVDQFANMADQSTALGKALFVAQKALAIATTIIQYEVAIAQAKGQLGIFGIPMEALLRAQQVAAVAAIAGQTVAGFEGGGITFNGVRSGGMDGKGGRLAMVHPNEKITDLEKGGDMGGSAPVNVNFNITANDAKGFDQLLASRRGLITNLVNQAINNRGRSNLA